MKSNYTHVSMLLDRSGSMSVIKTDTIGGFNNFIDEQKKVPGEMTLTLCQFNTEYENLHNVEDVKKVSRLTEETFKPSGGTALFDSIAKLIINTGKHLAELSEDKRPERVMVVIITDGEENSSHEYKGQNGQKKIAEMVKHQEEKYNWQFIYIGANQDAFKNAGAMNMSGVNYTASAAGTHSLFAAVTDNVTRNRSAKVGNKVTLTQDDVDNA